MIDFILWSIAQVSPIQRLANSLAFCESERIHGEPMPGLMWGCLLIASQEYRRYVLPLAHLQY